MPFPLDEPFAVTSKARLHQNLLSVSAKGAP